MNSLGYLYHKKNEIEKLYENDKISFEDYEWRVKKVLVDIYERGSYNDKENAERMAKAHGYVMKELL